MDDKESVPTQASTASQPNAMKFTIIGDSGGWEGPRLFKSHKEYEAVKRHDEDRLSIHVRARIARARKLLSDERAMVRIADEKKIPLTMVRTKLRLLCNPDYNDTEEEEAEINKLRSYVPKAEDFNLGDPKITVKWLNFDDESK